MQARFWTHHNGLVRIKLNAGQTVSHSHGGATDEGYSWTAETYSFDGHTVTCEWHTDSRDCDGRMTRGGEVACSVRNLSRGFRDDECGVTFPEWQEIEAHQRDHAAEAMNY